MNTEIVKVNGQDQRGVVSREDFSGQEMRRTAETAAISVAARERAIIESRYLMAERHPRNWDSVRVRLLGHCDRPGFAEVARYKKPAGKKKVNGQWIESFAEGLSARFAETARQEMGNTDTATEITYEDDLIRIVRATVVDLERNSIESRSLPIAKAVEKRGKQNGGEWSPPEGREVLSSRINSYGDPVYLVRATDDEIRMKQNSEISKATRDASLRLIPKDIRDEAEIRVVATLADPKKTDPTAARKRLVDAFAALSVLPDDLVTYIGSALDRISPAQLSELRGLYSAINDGEISFQDALRRKYDTQSGGDDQDQNSGAETTQQHDLRLQRQMEEQAATLRAKAEAPVKQEPAEDRSLTPEENRALDAKLASEEQQPRTKPVFGKKGN